MFVHNDKVAVVADEEADLPVDQQNIIYIRPKMDVGAKNRVTSAANTLRQEKDGVAEFGFDLGAYNIALLTVNIVGWAGPLFNDVACTPENIQRLDPDEPLVEKVLRDITQRNKSRKAADPKGASTTPGDAGSTASAPS